MLLPDNRTIPNKLNRKSFYREKYLCPMGVCKTGKGYHNRTNWKANPKQKNSPDKSIKEVHHGI